jgi:hypothetical protein
MAERRPGPRQLYARDTRLGRDAPLVFIEPGGAPRLRADCHQGWLVCPVPDCPDPRLIARGGTRRDHFAHRRLDGATSHAPERWYHLCSKALVGAWLQSRYPMARVQVDHEAVANRQVPDVLAVFPDGRRFAFEIQYAPLTIEAWQRRHAGYVAQQISDVWLFGHIPPHLRAAPLLGERPRFIFSELFEAIELCGADVRWIDPDQRTIRTPQHRLGWQRVHSKSGRLLLVEAPPEPLASCFIDGGAFRAPADAQLEPIRPGHLLELAREVERRAARRAQAEAHQHAVDRVEARRRPALEAAWDAYRRAKFGDPEHIPPIIALETPSDRGIAAYLPAHWHARLFEELIQGRRGQTFSYRRAAAPFLQHALAEPRAVYRALTAYLVRLRRAGYLAFETTPTGYITSPIRVLADTRHPPAAHERHP